MRERKREGERNNNNMLITLFSCRERKKYWRVMEYCAELPADVMQKCSVCHLGTNLFAKPTTADCGKKKIMNTKICYQQLWLKGRKGVMPQLLTPPTIVDGGNSCSCLAMMIPQVMRDSINFKCLHQLHFINQWAKQSTCCGNTCYAYIPVWNLSGTSYICKKHTAH